MAVTYYKTTAARDAARNQRVLKATSSTAKTTSSSPAWLSPSKTIKPQASPSTYWNIEGWGWNQGDLSQGAFSRPPVLNVNGQKYTFNSPEEYVNALQNLKAQGYTNTDSIITQMISGAKWFKGAASKQQGAVLPSTKAQEEKLRADMFTAREQDIAGNIRIQTGDPTIDALLNTYLDEIWGGYKELIKNLPGPVTEADTRSMEQEVERIFGPSLQRLKQTAEEHFAKQLGFAKEQRGLSEGNLTRSLARGTEDVATAEKALGEDVTRQERILGRNLAEAQKDVALSYANAGRAVSGRRKEAEIQLQTGYTEDAQLLNLLAERERNQMSRGQQRLSEDVDIQRQRLDLQERALTADIDMQRKSTDQKIADFKAQALQSKLSQAESLPYEFLPSLLEQPDFAKIAPEYTVGIPTTSQPSTLNALSSYKSQIAARDTARQQRILSMGKPASSKTSGQSVMPTIPVPTVSPSKTQSASIRSLNTMPRPRDLSNREWDLYQKRLQAKNRL